MTRTKSRFFSLAITVACWYFLSGHAGADPIVVGPARFTVVTPECIRLEYAPDHGFVDAPTLFAINRGAYDVSVKVVRSHGSLVVETSKLRLVYHPDGRPFSVTNLSVTFKNGERNQTWLPGQANGGNLGGPMTTLDGVSGPVDLPPGLLSRDGWGLVDDSGKPILKQGWIAPRPGSEPVTQSDAKNVRDAVQDVDWYLFAYGRDFRGALQSLTTLSGRAALPRKEVMGSWYCRWHRYTADDFRGIVQGYTDHDFPLDILVMDMDWHRQDAKTGFGHAGTLGWTGYSWNYKLIPDPSELLQEFRKKGIYVTLNDHPADGIRSHEDAYPDFMRLLGGAAPPGSNPSFDAGNQHYVDAFFQAAHAPLEKQGVDFWWLDWQQDYLIPYVPGVPGLRHLPWLNQLYFEDSERSGLRGQDYSRWGGWGDQRHPIQFSGDTSGSWATLAFEVPFTLASGNAGCFFWAHDTGGFYGARNPELYTRWTQFSGLSAALRVHSVGDETDRRPWLWGPQAENSMRITYHLRAKLFPYVYTSARQSYDTSQPLLRPLYVSYPNSESAYHYANEYLFGDNVLAAPIVTPGTGTSLVAAQSLWFPPGLWYNYFTGERFRGGTEALVTADINEFPLYVRGGAPLPMQPYTPRMASTPIKELHVRIYPGAVGEKSASTLYEDDGRTSAYKTGGFSRTPLSYSRRKTSVVVTIGAVQGHYQGQITQRRIVIELPNTGRATRVTSSAGGLPIAQYDPVMQLNTIVLPSQPASVPVTVTIACTTANPDALQASALMRRIQGITGSRPASANVKALLSSWSTLSAVQEAALLRTVGIGLIKKTDGPNFRSEKAHSVFYAPLGLLDGAALKVYRRKAPPMTLVLTNGAVSIPDSAPSGASPTIQFQIGGQTFQVKNGSQFGLDDVAMDATATASSAEEGHTADAAIDGLVEGYPNNPEAEWSSNGQTVGATLTLTWDVPQTVDRIVLFDRPNPIDHVTSGLISFSDGSVLTTGELSKDKTTGTELRFAPKTITSLTFKVTGVTPGTQNAGLSEIAVFKVPKTGAPL